MQGAGRCRFPERPRLIHSALASSALPLLHALNVGEEIVDLGWFETELRHRRVADQDAFGEGFFQSRDRIIA